MIKKPGVWLYPHAYELEYVRQLKNLAKMAGKELERRLFSRADADDDAPDYVSMRQEVAVAESLVMTQTETLVYAVKKAADMVNRFNEMQHLRVLKRVYGADIYKPEPFIGQMLDMWITENVRLINSIPSQYFDGVRAMIAAAAANGTNAAELTNQIRSSYGQPISRAELIATDQIGKLNGQLMRARQQNIGVGKYRWRGKLDDRERDEHVRREGKVFSWDSPPSDGHPGQAIRCRCHAEGIYPAIEDLDALLFGDGGDNRHYAQQMQQRGLSLLGTQPLPKDIYSHFGFAPRGTQQNIKKRKV